jgi:ArsR family transcriptional regulator
MEMSAIGEMKAEVFRALGHPMRIRILERLAGDERSVGELQGLLAIDAGGISAHLGTLRKQGLVEARRDGTSVFYRVRDARILQMLELARQLLSAQLQDTQVILRDLDTPESQAGAAGERQIS